MPFEFTPSPLFLRTSTIQLINCLLSKVRKCKILPLSTGEGRRQNARTPLANAVIKLTEFLWHCNAAEIADEARMCSAGDLVFQVNRQAQIN